MGDGQPPWHADRPVSASPLRVLLSAFSCEPGRGSEPEVGYRTLLGAAERHEVWALVSATGLPALEAGLAGHPARQRIHLVPIPVGTDESKLGLLEFHLRYARWQRRAATCARQLDRQFDFDVVHHVTLSPMWTPVGVAALPKPLVWGPVGGTVEAPLALLTTLGARGIGEDAARTLARRVLARAPWARAAARHADVVLAQNGAAAARLRCSGDVRVLSNGTAVQIPAMGVPTPPTRTGDIAFIGRLVPWKGTVLAVRALHHTSHTRALLRFYGSGPDEDRIRSTARRWGVAHRIRFEGWLPRDELLRRITTAGVVLHPSLHDEAGLSVAETLTVGTPVVCLAHGGPAEVVANWPAQLWTAVPLGPPGATAQRLAAAVDAFLAAPPSVPAEPIPATTSFADAVEDAYRTAVDRARAGAA